MKYIDNLDENFNLKLLKLNELEILASEVRQFIVDSVSETGGHLGASLGTVELSIALHKVFNFPKDKLVWDIGHQSYTHKILTGRKDKFHTLRKKDGISGFSAPYESEYDPFIGGHSSTSISSGFGLKLGLQMQGDDSHVISVIGDSSIASGMALEGINHIGNVKSKMIVILNDNEMSISKPQGALSKYFTKVKSSTPFSYIKDLLRENVVDKLPKTLSFLVEKADSFTRITKEANIFEALGFSYVGVLDGHDLETLIEVLENIKNYDSQKPILLHVITKKGKGYLKAENASDCMHGIEGKQPEHQVDTKLESNTAIFSQNLIKKASTDNKIVAITAAMPTGTGLDKFEAIYKDRFFDVGIAEQHATTFAAGLAKSGLKPFVCIYSTFMQRAYDQVVHDVAISSLPVRFIMDRAGFVGADGATHHGLLDYAMFLPLPNIVFMCPAFKEDIPKMLDIMCDINDKPTFMRFSKVKSNNNSRSDLPVIFGKGYIVQQGKDIAVLSIGEVLQDILEANDMLKKDNLNITIADARFAKPIDEDLIINLVNHHKTLITVEEGYGKPFANLVLEVIQKHNLLNKITLKSISVPSNFIEQASITEQKQLAGLDSISLYNFIKTNI
ncbi:MAG: 1-deoxy-D-xylulose-5-phosphate synthase [Alphaproteobacteria bacterium]|jgi:1-deoxy-D-xylulose-5-phosphate synthase|nr:1-deoxy-D-xylulose-5-phosphate synthase [Alphaproteobacteria bacterium]